jgi:hypothetical protein
MYIIYYIFLTFSQRLQYTVIKTLAIYYVTVQYFASRYCQQNDDDDGSRNTSL